MFVGGLASLLPLVLPSDGETREGCLPVFHSVKVFVSNCITGKFQWGSLAAGSVITLESAFPRPLLRLCILNDLLFCWWRGMIYVRLVPLRPSRCRWYICFSSVVQCGRPVPKCRALHCSDLQKEQYGTSLMEIIEDECECACSAHCCC